jgi:cytochrome c oxidase subunit 2
VSSASPFWPAGPVAGQIATLFIVVLVLAALVLLLVWGLLAYALINFRARPGTPDPPPVYGNRRLEIAWTAGPILLLLVVFVLMVATMRSVSAAPQATNAQLTITATGNQWWWRYDYPEGVVAANEVHIPAGEPVQFNLVGADVIHSFWFPELAGKRDMVPGKTNTIWLQADQSRLFQGWCSEFCGVQHAGMLLRLIAEPRDQFQAWLALQAQPAASPATDQTRRGAQVFQSQTCASCHTIRGTPAGGQIAPDLTHVGGRQTLAAGLIDNTPANLESWLRDPQAIKPGSRMPQFDLPAADLTALAAYLASLK